MKQAPIEKLLKAYDRMALNIHLQRVADCTSNGKIDVSKLFIPRWTIAQK